MRIDREERKLLYMRILITFAITGPVFAEIRVP